MSNEMNAEQDLGPRRIYTDRPPDAPWVEPLAPPLHFEAVLADGEKLIHFSPFERADGAPFTLVLTDRALYEVSLDEAASKRALKPDAFLVQSLANDGQSPRPSASFENTGRRGSTKATSASSADDGSWLGRFSRFVDEVVTGMSQRPPDARKGTQQWRQPQDGLVVTRFDLQLIELLDVRVDADDGDDDDDDDAAAAAPAAAPAPAPAAAGAALAPPPLAPPPLAPPPLAPPPLAPPPLAPPPLAPPALAPPPLPGAAVAAAAAPAPPPEIPELVFPTYTLRVAVPKEKGVKYQIDKQLSSEEANNPYHELRYTCPGAAESTLWQVALQASAHAHWQALLETEYIRPPEVYQLHLHAKKVNRKGVPQPRTLALSDASLYNIEREGAAMRELKWMMPVEALQAIELQELDAAANKKLASEHWSVTLRMKSKAGIRRASNNPLASSKSRRELLAPKAVEKEDFTFAVKTREEFQALVAALSRVYFALTQEHLPRYEPTGLLQVRSQMLDGGGRRTSLKRATSAVE